MGFCFGIFFWSWQPDWLLGFGIFGWIWANSQVTLSSPCSASCSVMLSACFSLPSLFPPAEWRGVSSSQQKNSPCSLLLCRKMSSDRQGHGFQVYWVQWNNFSFDLHSRQRKDVQWAPRMNQWGALGWCSSFNTLVQSCALHNICDLKFQQDEIFARAEEAVKMGTLPRSSGVTAAHTWVTFSCQLWCWQQYLCTDCANLPRTLGEHLAADVLSVTPLLLFVPQPGNFRCIQDGKASHSPPPKVHNSKGVNQNAWNLLVLWRSKCSCWLAGWKGCKQTTRPSWKHPVYLHMHQSPCETAPG